jgi:hypothetical protein
VAPSVLLSALAILPAGVFPRASVFSSRMSVLVHSRRFEFFLAISSPFKKEEWGNPTKQLGSCFLELEYENVN